MGKPGRFYRGGHILVHQTKRVTGEIDICATLHTHTHGIEIASDCWLLRTGLLAKVSRTEGVAGVQTVKGQSW